jgi:hypothetical protein
VAREESGVQRKYPSEPVPGALSARFEFSIPRCLLVSVDTVCKFCGSPFLKVIVTGYNSAVRPKHLTSPRNFSYSNTVPTTPGNIGWLADNGSDWNRGESNVDLSERSGQAGRGCGDSS